VRWTDGAVPADTMIRVFGRGHHAHAEGPRRRPPPTPTTSVLIKRRWRLGDVIMCEPACRELSARGASILFCTGTEYHAVVQCFHEPSPRVLTYPPPKSDMVRVADREVDLDVVTLDHPGYTTKVDAFLGAAGIDPAGLEPMARVPAVVPHPRHDAWARTKLAAMGILGEPIIGIVRTPYDARSPRSLPDHVIDELGTMLSVDHHVVYIGATPTRIEPRDRIHNMTGITPDVMFAAALMMHLRALVTVDTGLMHLAGAIGVPMVTVMGPTRPDDLATIYPGNTILDVGRECSPCYDRGCEERCLDGVTAEAVFELTRSRADHPDTPTIIHR